MKKLLFFLSLVLLVSCSSTRQPDNTTYYKNYFSSVSLDNTSVVDQPVVPDTNYTDTNSTINVNLYTNSYWNWPYRNIYTNHWPYRNIYTNHWPYTNNIYSNDYYRYYHSYYTPLHYYQPHHSVTIRVFSDYIETAKINEVDSVPSYSFYSTSDENFRWRDLYTYGFIDNLGRGVDYPFFNGAQYPYSNTIFKLIPDDRDFDFNDGLTGLEVPYKPLIDRCE
jgi:hypothetical protein